MADQVVQSPAKASTNLNTPRSPLSYAFLSNFFKTWVKSPDLATFTTMASMLTIYATLSGGLSDLKNVIFKIYWWFTKFFTSSISVASCDRLNREILNWLGAQVLSRQGTRILTARTENASQSDAFSFYNEQTVRNDVDDEKRPPVQYLPTFGTTWFFHKHHLFMVKLCKRQSQSSSNSGSVPQDFAAAPDGDEPLVVMCVGRSVKPIKQFFEECRNFSDKEREGYTTVRAVKDNYGKQTWGTTILKPIRPMHTVHFDQKTKDMLLNEIKVYMKTEAREYYNQRGVPYRKGLLLHGPPGTGKTSLSLALCGEFALDLYLLHLPSIKSDTELERLFSALPKKCIVLLEDIDAVGATRKGKFDEELGKEKDKKEAGEDFDSDSEDERAHAYSGYHCSLSGLLNVLDGVSSQEGRIVLMTSNMAHCLDKALIRPGRIDNMIFLGNISKESAEQMFLRMYSVNENALSSISTDLKHISERKLTKLAAKFSSFIPDSAFTPAMLQNYLLSHRDDPATAVDEIKTWVDKEVQLAEEEKRKEREAKAKARKKKKKEKLEALSWKLKAAAQADGADDEDVKKLEKLLDDMKDKKIAGDKDKDKKSDDEGKDKKSEEGDKTNGAEPTAKEGPEKKTSETVADDTATTEKGTTEKAEVNGIKTPMTETNGTTTPKDEV